MSRTTVQIMVTPPTDRNLAIAWCPYGNQAIAEGKTCEEVLRKLGAKLDEVKR